MRSLLSLLFSFILLVPSAQADQCLDIFPSSPVFHSNFHLSPLGSGGNNLNLGRNGSLNITGGVNTFYDSGSLGDRSRVNVTNNSTARLHFNGSVNIQNNVDINRNGSPEDLVIYINGNLAIGTGVEINAIIYVNGNAQIGSGGTINGAFTVNGNISNNGTSFTYDSSAIGSADFAGMCEAGGSGGTFPSPVVEYRFDDCSFENGITDTTGNFDGTSNNAPSVDSEKVINRSLDLSATGVLDWVTVPAGAVDHLNDFSLSVWIQTEINKTQQEVFHALGSDDEDDEIEVYLSGSTQVVVKVRGRSRTLNAGTTLTDGNWHQLTVTRSGSRVCLYTDGNSGSCSNSSRSGQISIGHASAVVIGQEQDSYGGSFSSSQAFEGYIDEFKIYDVALAQAQANTIYREEGRENDVNGNPRTPVTCSVVIPDPFAEYRMDEPYWDGTADEVKDNTGSGNHGSIIDIESGSISSGNVTSIDDGKICRAGRVGQNSAANSQYAIDTTIDIDDQVKDAGTISLWYRSSQNWGEGGRKVLLSASESSPTPNPNDKYFYLTEENDGRLRFGLENTSDADFRYYSANSFSFTPADWVHLTITWDMANSSMQLFVNGNQEVNASLSSSQSIGELFSLYVGDNRSAYVAGEGSNSANGDFDEVLIFDQVLSSQQIAEIYKNQNRKDNYDGSPRRCVYPVAEWRFDEPGWASGSYAAKDNVGNNDGLIAGGADTENATPVVSGNPGTCRYGEFNGSDSYVRVNNANADDFTMMAWIRPNSQGNTFIGSNSSPSYYGSPLFWSDLGGGSGNDFIFAGTGNRLAFMTGRNPNNGNSGDVHIRSNTDIAAGQWTHVAISRDKISGMVNIYVNGVLDGSGQAATGSTLDENPYVVFGGNPYDRRYFDGLMDEVRVYDMVLTQAEISNIKDETHPCSLTSSVSYYEVSHGLTGLTCESSTITITAKGDDGLDINPTAGTVINLSSELVSGDGSVANTFTPTSFTFDGSQASTDVQLVRTAPGVVDIDVSDGSVTDQDGQTTDPNITFADAAFKFYADGAVDDIGNQIAGKFNTVPPGNQTITIRAIQADPITGRCEALKPGSGTSVRFGYECTNPATCTGSNKLSVNGDLAPGFNSGQAEVYSSGSIINFDASGTGIITLNYMDAGQIRIYAQTDLAVTGGSGNSRVEGSSNLFAVRPFAFGFPSITAVVDTTTVPNAKGDEAGGASFTSAGSDFDVSVNAYLYNSSDDSNSDGVPDDGTDVTDNGVVANFAGNAAVSINSFSPDTGTLGTLSGTTSATLVNTDGDSSVTATMQYSEVGSVSIQADHSNYLGLTDFNINSAPEKIGRFYPHHFVLNSSVVSAGCSVFTYMQQPFSSVGFQAEARSELGGRTQNYDNDSLGYLDAADFTFQAENADGANGAALSGRLTYTTAASINWIDGRYDFTSTNFIFQRQGNSETGLEDGPYGDLQLGVNVLTELDDREFSASAMDMNPTTSGDCTSDTSCTAVKLDGEQDLRYGRIRIQSAHAPETEDLPVPFAVEYWNGSAFVTNTDDNCSVLPLSNISFDGNMIDASEASRTVTVGDGSTLGRLNISGSSTDARSGEFNLSFRAPGAGTGGDDNTDSFPVAVQVPDALRWLRYDWDQDGSAGDTQLPESIITFGRARGSDRMIFWQERYQ